MTIKEVIFRKPIKQPKGIAGNILFAIEGFRGSERELGVGKHDIQPSPESTLHYNVKVWDPGDNDNYGEVTVTRDRNNAGKLPDNEKDRVVYKAPVNPNDTNFMIKDSLDSGEAKISGVIFYERRSKE